MKNYIAEGKSIAHTPSGTSYVSGDVVVIGTILGVAAVDIADGEEGTVCIEGVFDLPKADSAVIAQGETLTWDITAGEFDDDAATPASGDITGAAAVAVEAKGATTGGTIRVKLTGVPGTVTA